MNWIERYVESVRRYLPSADREDIGEEISSILEAKVEDIEQEKGARLSEEETLALLKDFGHPLRIASKYRNTQFVVSESLLPLYKQVVKFLLLGLFSLLVASSIISMSGLAEWWPDDIDSVIINITFVWFVLITGLFVFSDSLFDRVDLFQKWNPARLPKVYPASFTIPIFDSVVGLITGLVVLTILSAISSETSWAIVSGRSDTPWLSVVFWCKVQIFFGMLIHGVSLFRPFWSRTKLYCRAAGDVLIALIASFALMIDGNHVLVLITLLAFWLVGVSGALYSFYQASLFDKHDPGSLAPDLLATKLGLSAAATHAKELVEANVEEHGEKALEQLNKSKNGSD